MKDRIWRDKMGVRDMIGERGGESFELVILYIDSEITDDV